MRRRLILLVMCGALIAGCGGEQESAAPETVTVERTAEPTPAPTEEAPPAEEEAASGGSITVPDVVGEDHQLAQDTMQAAGLYNLAEEDATGQGRAMLLDRNWEVVSQSPKAGTKVAEDRTITLRAKKDGE